MSNHPTKFTQACSRLYRC